MNAVTDPRIDLLRAFEEHCFQVAHYLLGNEKDAAAASENALIELFRSHAFAGGSEEERKRLAKEAAIRSALKQAGRRQSAVQ
ncbi:hypothetical protein ACFPYJ_21765 [Paenibacillus solisilvae]|uniref:Uncharacterized protein n=1 Tax=Paenibacillus solisilvae TaxID=2486751 RepID=A0ABW0W4K9_9BACL